MRDLCRWILPVDYVARFVATIATSLVYRIREAHIAAIHSEQQQRLIDDIRQTSETERVDRDSEIQRLKREIQHLHDDLDFRDVTIENLQSTLAIKEGELRVAGKQIEMLLAWQTTWTEKMRAEASISIAKSERAVFDTLEAKRPREAQ